MLIEYWLICRLLINRHSTDTNQPMYMYMYQPIPNWDLTNTQPILNWHLTDWWLICWPCRLIYCLYVSRHLADTRLILGWCINQVSVDISIDVSTDNTPTVNMICLFWHSFFKFSQTWLTLFFIKSDKWKIHFLYM